MPNVRMPNGTIIKNVPAGITKKQLLAKLEANEYDVPSLLTPPQEKNALEKMGSLGNVAASVADIPLSFTEGLAGVGKSFTDIFGAGNAASNFLGDIAEGAAGLRSSESRADAIANAIAMERASDKGAWEQVKAAGSSLLRSPLDTTASVLGSAAPFVVAGLAAAPSGGSSLAPIASMAGLGAVSGAGTIKGSVYDAVYEESKKAGLSEERAKAIAEQAQEYGGENTDQIALGGIIGAAANATGLPRQLSSAIAKRSLQRLATETAEQTVAREAGEQVGRKSLLLGAAKGAVEEAVPEAIQGAQERYAQNKALQREGYDINPMKGVIGQGAFEGLASLALGGFGGASETSVKNREGFVKELEAVTEELPDEATPETLDAFSQRFTRWGIDDDTAKTIVQNLDATKKALAAQEAEAQRKFEEQRAAQAAAGEPGAAIEDEQYAAVTGAVPPSKAIQNIDRQQAARDFQQQMDEANARNAEALATITPPPTAPKLDVSEPVAGMSEEEANAINAEALSALTPQAAPTAAPTPRPRQQRPNLANPTPVMAQSILDDTSGNSLRAYQDAMGGIDEDEAIDRLNYIAGRPSSEEELPSVLFNQRGRPAQTSADEGLFGSELPKQEQNRLDKAEELAQLKLNTTAEERIAQQENVLERNIAEAQERMKRDEEQREETLGDLEYALRAQAPENAVYKTLYTPEDKKAPYKLLAETQLGVEPQVVLTAPTLEEFSDTIYDRMMQLTPYAAPTEDTGEQLSAQTVEPVDKTEPSVATDMIRQFSNEVDDLHQDKQIDNNQRAELMSRLERPNAYRTLPDGRQVPNDAIARLEAQAKKATEAFRNAKDDAAREEAADKLDEINKQLTAAVQNGLLNPLRARMKSMVGTRKGKRQEAAARVTTATARKKPLERLVPAGEKVEAKLATAPEEVGRFESAAAEAEKRIAKAQRILDKLRNRKKRDMLREQPVEDTLKSLQKELDTAEAQLGRSLEREERYQATKKAIEDLRRSIREEQRKIREAKIDLKETKVQFRKDDGANTTPEERERIQKAVENKTPEEVMQWVAKNDPNPLRRAIATKVLQAMRSMQRMGGTFAFRIITPTSVRPATGRDGTFVSGMFALGEAKVEVPGTSLRGTTPDTRTVWVKNTEFGNMSGMDYETILHEFIHAVTIEAIARARSNRQMKFTPMGVGVGQIERAYSAFMKHFNQRVADTSNPLTAFEQQMYSGEANTIANVWEFTAWALSSQEFQAYLAKIPYDVKNSLWDKFVQAIKKVFNIPGAEASMLAEILQASDRIMSADPAHFAEVMKKKGFSKEVEITLFNKRGKPKITPKTEEELLIASGDVSDGLRRTQTSTSVYGLAQGIGQAIRGHSMKGYIDAFKDNWIGMKPFVFRSTLKSIPTSGILDWFGGRIPALKEVDKFVNKMINMKANIIAAADDLATELQDFVNVHGADVLAAAQSISRINEYAPDQFKSMKEALQKHGAMQQIEGRILSNSSDKVRAKEIIEELKALVVAGKSTKPAKGGSEKKMMTIQSVKLLNELHGMTLDNKVDTREQVTQIIELSQRIRDVHRAWDKLGEQKNGRELYKKLRQYYKDMFEAELALLDERIAQFADEEQAKRLRDVRAELMRQTISPDEAKQQGDIFYNLDAKHFQKDYFPFMREGNYWLYVKAKKGVRERQFYTFNSAVELNRAKQEVARKLGVNPDSQEDIEVGNDIATLQETFRDEDAMMQKVFALVEQARGKAKRGEDLEFDDLRDSIYQTWLMTTPERSVRRRLMHADEVTGYSSDLLNHFSRQVTSYANQLSKMAYAGRIRNEIKGAKDNIKSPDTPNEEARKLRDVIQEMETRAEQEIKPDPQSAFVNILNRMSFFYYLTSGATALVQTTAIPIRVVPRLWREYGFAKGTAMWIKYMKLWNSLGYPTVTRKPSGLGDQLFAKIPSVLGSDFLKTGKNAAVLQRAAKEATQRNLLQTVTDTLVQNEREAPLKNRDGVLGTTSAVLAETGNVMGVMFRGMENITRQASFFMTFELAYEDYKSKNFDKDRADTLKSKAAAEEAKKLNMTLEQYATKVAEDMAFNHAMDKGAQMNRDALGDFSSFERPSLLKGNLTRALFLFKMYAIIQTKFFVQSFNQIVRGVGGDRVGAIKELTGVLMMAGMFGGLMGMPLYSLMAYALAQGFDDEDDEDVKKLMGLDPRVAYDSDIMFRKWLVDTFGNPETGDTTIADLLLNGPTSVLTNTDVGSRTSLDLKNMWFREAVSGDTTEMAIFKTIMANVAGGAMIGQFANAKDDFANGNIEEGLKKALPGFFRSFVAAGQMAEEGVQDRKGNVIIPKRDITAFDESRALLGFRPLDLARWQDYYITRAKNEKRIQSEKRRILDRLEAGIREGDITNNKQLREFIKEEVVPFNRTYPDQTLGITEETIVRSLRGRESTRGMTVRGMQLDKKTAQRDYEMAKSFMPK